MSSGNHPSCIFTWKISNYSQVVASKRKYCSETFTVAGCKWKLVIPEERFDDETTIYLRVAGHSSLPFDPMRKFTEDNVECRFKSYRGFDDPSAGFLVQDTLVLEAKVVVLEVVPPVVAHDSVSKDRSVAYFDSLGAFIGAPESYTPQEGPSSGTQNSHTFPPVCSTKEVENAKQSLKECLSDLSKLDLKERLASALSTLSVADTGLSPGQRKSVSEFLVHFDGFISDYLTFEQGNSDYELQKLQSRLLFSAMMKIDKTDLSYKELSEKLSREEQELEKKLEETRSRKAKLVSDREALIAESEETKAKYLDKKQKVADADSTKAMSS